MEEIKKKLNLKPYWIILSFIVLILQTTAAQWLSDKTFGLMGLEHMPLLATIALITLFNIIIH